VAEEIALGLGCSARHVSETNGLAEYELVVLGTPNQRKAPSPAMRRFLSGNGRCSPELAVFATFGMPVWGQVSAPICLRNMAAQWGKKPIARYSCPGYHTKHKTYKGRPNDSDLLSAFLFGLRLSKWLENRHKE
jgi:hypothetical protein